MQSTRRGFIKANAVAAAVAAAGISSSTSATNLITTDNKLTWAKAPCRFCGTGCSMNVATRNNRVVATHGDINSPVNKGLACVKGYFLSKIMYGEDRLTQPLLRKTNGKYDKNGEFSPVSWDEAFDIMEQKFKAALKEKGPRGVGMFGSGQWTVWEGYAAALRCCMVVRASLSGARQSPEIRERVKKTVAELDDAFHTLLQRARYEGTLGNGSKPRDSARFLTTTFQALNVAALAGRSRRELRQIIRNALTTLE